MVKNAKDSSDLTQTLSQVATIVHCAHGTSNVQCHWHYLKLSAPGTCNVQCPWHYHYFHCCSLLHPVSEWVLVSPLHLGHQPFSGMIWELACLVVGFLLVFSFPLGMEWILAIRLQCPPLLIGQSPPAPLWYVMEWHTAQCQLVGHTANVIHLLLFFSSKKSIFICLFASATGQPTCAS